MSHRRRLKNKQGYPGKEPDVKGKEEAYRRKEGQLREVSHNPGSLSLTLTHCPSASCHSYQIHHPRHASTTAQPQAAAFPLSLMPLILTLPGAFPCATDFFPLNSKLNCFFKYSSADVFHNHQQMQLFAPGIPTINVKCKQMTRLMLFFSWD